MSSRGNIPNPGNSQSLRSSPHNDTSISNRGRGQPTPLSPADSRILGRVHTSSNNGVGRADRAAVFQHSRSNEVDVEPNNTVHQDDDDSRDDDLCTQRGSNVADVPSFSRNLPYVTPVGNRFGNGQVHHRIRLIFDEFFNEPWKSFSKIPKDVHKEMFGCFGTYYQWDPTLEKSVEANFKFVLKERVPDILSTYRSVSRKLAIEAGHFIPPNKYNFAIMRDFPPNLLDPNLWRGLCDVFDTPAFEKQSQSGRTNRLSKSVCLHTGGSMSNEERRIRLAKKLRRQPTFLELFLDTHLSKEAKKKFWDGDYEHLEMLQFSTSSSKEIIEKYLSAMRKTYGEDLSKHPPNDIELWKQSQEGISKNKRVYGAGSSDVDFVITGSSSSQRSNPLAADYERSQKRVRELEEQCAQMAQKHDQMAEKQSQFEVQLAELAKKLSN